VDPGLESLGGKAGPEDIRTQDQRDHDALEEACRRLLGARCLPDRAGQHAQIRAAPAPQLGEMPSLVIRP
jgi:hypothetical protein